MKNIHLVLLVIFLSSCATIDIPELYDPELKKNKIFVLSNSKEFGAINVRVNGVEREIKFREIQTFELKQGENSIYSFDKAFGVEFGSCNDEPYTFDTKIFEEQKTHYFILSGGYSCYGEFHVTEEGFLKTIETSMPIMSEFLLDAMFEAL